MTLVVLLYIHGTWQMTLQCSHSLLKILVGASIGAPRFPHWFFGRAWRMVTWRPLGALVTPTKDLHLFVFIAILLGGGNVGKVHIDGLYVLFLHMGKP